jgi:hypothetical protein
MPATFVSTETTIRRRYLLLYTMPEDTTGSHIEGVCLVSPSGSIVGARTCVVILVDILFSLNLSVARICAVPSA